MKNIFLCILILSFVGCDAKTVDMTSEYKLPPELNDCNFYYVRGGGSSKDLYVVRCPNSSTSTTWNEQQGKTTTSETVSTIN